MVLAGCSVAELQVREFSMGELCCEGVAEWGSCKMGALQCGRVAIRGSCSLEVHVAVLMCCSCDVGELQCVEPRWLPNLNPLQFLKNVDYFKN